MITYILQVTLCSTLLYVYYYFCLRNERFHQYNRFYLLGAIIFSILIPLIKIPVSWHTASTVQTQINTMYLSVGENVVIYLKGANHVSIQKIIMIISLFVSSIFFIRLLSSIFQIVALKRGNLNEKKEGFTLILTAHSQAPFSFFNWLFWNKKIQLTSSEGNQILDHELYHITKKHSIDVLLIEIMLCVFWMNPIFYFYRKEIKAIQEFLADQYASKHVDENEYAQLLVVQAIASKQFPIVNPFFHNQLKRRIMMLTLSNPSKYQYVKKILVLPTLFLVGSLFAFSYQGTLKAQKPIAQKEEKITRTEITLVEINKKNKPTPPQKKTKKDDKFVVTEITLEEIKEDTTKPKMVFSKVEEEAQFPGGVTEWRKFLEKNINGSIAVENGAPVGNYIANIQFIVHSDGSISDVKSLNKVGYGIDEEAVRVVKNSGKWIPAKQNKKAVSAYRIQPITFQVSN